MKSYVKVSCVDCPSLAKGVPADDIVWLQERKLDLALACPRCTNAPEITLNEAQWLQERRLGLGLTCKDCGEFFIMSPDEIVWLLENELKLFKRCSECRQINREKNAVDEEKKRLNEGLEECARRLEETDQEEIVNHKMVCRSPDCPICNEEVVTNGE